MNFGHLKIFQAVAQSGNISRAAESLLISQPAVSKQLKQLEKTIGAVLFNRHSKGMSLTAAGAILAEYANRIFAISSDAEQAMDDLSGLRRGRLIIGATTTIGIYLLPQVFVRFRNKYPAIQLDLEIGHSDVIARGVLSGQTHLALTESLINESHLKATVFAKDRLCAIAPVNHPLAQKRSVTARMLCREPFVVRETGSGTKSLVEQALIKKGLTITTAMSLGSTEAIKRAVAGGIGVAIVSQLSIELELKAKQLIELRLTDLSIQRPLYHLVNYDFAESAAARAFMMMVAETVKPP